MIQSCGRRKKPKQKEKTGSSSTWRMSNLREIVENLINQYQSSYLSDLFFLLEAISRILRNGQSKQTAGDLQLFEQSR